MCYIFITFQGRASFWGEPGQAFAPVFLLAAPGGWTSGKGCWLPLRVKKPSVASLSPEELRIAKGSESSGGWRTGLGKK